MATNYPWNSVRPAVREVIIEKSQPMVSNQVIAKEIMYAQKSTDHKLHTIMQQNKCNTAKILKQQHCAEKRLRKRLRDIEFLEILKRNRGGGDRGNNTDELALLLLADRDDGGDDSTLALAALLEDGRRGGGGGNHHDRELIRAIGGIQRRLDRVTNNLTQIDTVLGITPINPGGANPGGPNLNNAI